MKAQTFWAQEMDSKIIRKKILGQVVTLLPRGKPALMLQYRK
jgi:hypothetical protein